MLHCTEQHLQDPETSTEVTPSTGTYSNDERTLLQRVVAHDEQAFAVLYNRYAPVLQRSLRRSLRQDCLVDEVLDDVMLVLWQDGRHFPPTVPLGAWLQGIARHKAYKALRRQATCASLVPDQEHTPDAPVDPETLFLQHEQATLLSQELAAMAPLDRLFLEKFLYQGCSYQEMAEQTGTPLNTVKVRILRARRRLTQRFSASRLEDETAA